MRKKRDYDILNIKSEKYGAGGNYTNFSSILRNETTAIFLERFTNRLIVLLKKAYSENKARQIATLLERNKLMIECPESFLFKYGAISDPSLYVYNSVKDLDEFFFEMLYYFRNRAEDGDSDIIMREFLIVLLDIFSVKKTENLKKMDFYMKYLIFFMSNFNHPSPFILQIFHPQMLKWVGEYCNIDLRRYSHVYSYLFLHLNGLLRKNFLTKKEAYFPKIELVYPVYPSARIAQIYYLASIFRVLPEETRRLSRKIISLSERTPELDIFLESSIQKSGLPINIKTLYSELRRLEEEQPLKTYPLMTELYDGMQVVNKNIFNKQVNKVFISTTNYQYTFQPYNTCIIINCEHSTNNMIEAYMDAAKNLALLSGSALGKFNLGSSDSRINVLSFAIKLKLINVENLTKEFLKFVDDKIEQIKSNTGRNFVYEIRYSNKKMQKHSKFSQNEYIRVISDIHADYNRDKNYAFNFGNDFVINCGDTAGNSIESREWNKLNIRKGVVVAGNHLGYSMAHPELGENHPKNTKNEQVYEMGVALTGDSTQPRILSNSETEFEGIKIIGCTLYTDFALYGKEHIEESMAYAEKGMNDFKLINVIGHREYRREDDDTWTKIFRSRKNSEVRKFTVHDHAYYFSFSLAYLKEKVTQYKNKPVIIVTHHAPTPYAISPQYAGSKLNPAFASNLNQFIIDNPNIRLWTFGHIHSSCDIILGETRLVCEPFGYGNENNQELKLPFDYGKRIKIKDIKSTASWRKILEKEIKRGEIQVYDK